MTPAAVAEAPAAERATIDDIPTWFGLFKPVGWLMVGLPSPAQAEALERALHRAGWTAATVLRFDPGESAAQLQALTDDPGPLAGFGYEITLLRRYADLARHGFGWRLVKVEDDEQAAQAAVIARENGATLAVHYRMLTVEELI